MYLTIGVIEKSLDHLKKLHPFFGTSFLVFKKINLPIGSTKKVAINKEEDNFLKQYYRPDVSSKYFYSPFRTSDPQKRWRSPKYASAGSQATRTRGDLAGAFFHDKGTAKWGWKSTYIDVLKKKLNLDHTNWIPTFWLAVWLFRDKDWAKSTSPSDVLDYFFDSFSITQKEKERLFDESAPKGAGLDLFQSIPYATADLPRLIGPPPDADPEAGGTLKLIGLKGVGPSRSLSFEPGDRLTIITGDNGLGKSFLLECTWWSLSGNWAGNKALPRPDAKRDEPQITFEIAGTKRGSQKTPIKYNWEAGEWPFPKGRPTIPGLIVYARVDGSFAVWDPASKPEPSTSRETLTFSPADVLDGRKPRIEGIIRDWVRWQNNSDRTLFETFASVLKRLSPPDLGVLIPGTPIRISGDARDMPTLIHPYGEVPFINESAGVRRIITLAYLLVWAWNEHKVHSSITRKQPQRRMVILIDEIEAHLHPKWQREILPALLEVTNILSREIEPQILIATHSPLILASVETSFSEETDELYHLELSKEGNVSFSNVPFVRFGRVDSWLTSDLFDLKQARSREGEDAIERAKTVLKQPSSAKEEILTITEALRKTLTPDDVFWLRWAYFVQRKGISI